MKFGVKDMDIYEWINKKIHTVVDMFQIVVIFMFRKKYLEKIRKNKAKVSKFNQNEENIY